MSSRAISSPSRILGVFSAEARKARSFPAIPRTILGGAAALLAVAVFVASQATRFVERGLSDDLGGMTAADVIMIVLRYGQVIPILLGAWVVSQDLPVGPRHSAFLATARRGTLFVSKLVITAVVALLAGMACVIAALLPMAVSGDESTVTIELAPFAWLVVYWIVIAVVTASLVAASGSMTFTVVPILVWTIGLSDLLADRIPALDGVLDRVFMHSYLEGAPAPSSLAVGAAVAQAVVVLALGASAYARRDVG